MTVEKGHFHFAEKYLRGPRPPWPPLFRRPWNKLIKWNIPQVFLKALTSAQKLHCRTTIFEERLPMTATALKHDHDIIIKSAECLFWYEEVAGNIILFMEKAFQVFQCTEKFFMLFLSNFVPLQSVNFIFIFVKLIALKFRQ